MRRAPPRQLFASTRRVLLGLAVLSGASASPAHAETTVTRIAVSDLKPLLQRAAMTGYAQGLLEGPGAAYLAQKFDTQQPIEIAVKRLYRLAQADCGRLAVTTRQRDVREHGRRADQVLTWQVSFCADGQFPAAH